MLVVFKIKMSTNFQKGYLLTDFSIILSLLTNTKKTTLASNQTKNQGRIKRGAQGALAPGPPSSKGPPRDWEKNNNYYFS